MIVDDDEDQRWLTYDAVAQMEYDCSISQAATAEEALANLVGHDRCRPDILFLDIEMPGMGGLALLERIKLTPELQDIEVVVVSDSRDFVNRRLEALHRGADDFIEKSKDILGMIKHLQDKIKETVNVKLAVKNFE